MPGAVAPPDTEVVQVGDAIWQRAKRRGLVQGAVRPVRVIEILVLAQDGHQVALFPDQGPVQQLTPFDGPGQGSNADEGLYFRPDWEASARWAARNGLWFFGAPGFDELVEVMVPYALIGH